MDDDVRILCTNASCEHNNNTGYYGLCNHPDVKKLVPYGGIDRYYVSGCEKGEKK